MPRLKNIPIREKLQLFATVLLFALGSVGVVGYRGIQNVGSNIEKHQQYFATAQAILQVDMVCGELRAIAIRAVLLSAHVDEGQKHILQTELRGAVSSVRSHLDD